MYADGDMEGTNYAVAVVSPTFYTNRFYVIYFFNLCIDFTLILPLQLFLPLQNIRCTFWLEII